jgi:hypothetical protein
MDEAVLGSVTFCCGSGSADPTPDTTPFFSDVKDANNFFSYFFLITYPQAHLIFSLEKFNFCKNFVLKLILQALFQSAQHLYEKKEGSGSVPLTNGSRKPKNISLRIQIPPSRQLAQASCPCHGKR